MYVCHAATSAFCGSVGRYCRHRDSVPPYWTPPKATTFVAPVARMAFTSDCIPAASYGTPGQVPPSRQHVQAASLSWLLSGTGSLKSSRITASLPLNVVATSVQKAGE